MPKPPSENEDNDQTSFAPSSAEELGARREPGRGERLAQNRSTASGVVHLNVSERIAHTWLPKFLKHVSEVYPDLSMEIDVDNLPMHANEVIEQFVHQLRKLGAPEHAVRIDVTAALRDVLRSGPRAELEER
jgi:hypothetical protein